MPKDGLTTLISITLNEATGEAEVFIDCNGIGQCPTAAYLELEERWKKEGLEFLPTPGKGPFDFRFQVKQQSVIRVAHSLRHRKQTKPKRKRKEA